MNATRRDLLDVLHEGPATGPALAERLDVSRAAVWKHVEALRDDGFGIEGTDEGYVVRSVPEYGAAAVAFGLDAPYDVEFHETLGSTNDVGRERAGDDASNLVVLSEEQTGSRGRLSRDWVAPRGGVWMSLVLRPDRPPAHLPLFTLAAAVATARALRGAGVEATIKWPNDVLVQVGGETAKLAGILTEMEGEADRVAWLVVGIGLNANVDAAALPAGATSVRAVLGRDVNRRELVQRIVREFHALRGEADAVLPAWRSLSSTLGARVRVETPAGTVEGDAVDVTFPGALVVRTDDGEVTVHAGDCEHLRPA